MEEEPSRRRPEAEDLVDMPPAAEDAADDTAAGEVGGDGRGRGGAAAAAILVSIIARISNSHGSLHVARLPPGLRMGLLPGPGFEPPAEDESERCFWRAKALLDPARRTASAVMLLFLPHFSSTILPQSMESFACDIKQGSYESLNELSLPRPPHLDRSEIYQASTRQPLVEIDLSLTFTRDARRLLQAEIAQRAAGSNRESTSAARTQGGSRSRIANLGFSWGSDEDALCLALLLVSRPMGSGSKDTLLLREPLVGALKQPIRSKKSPTREAIVAADCNLGVCRVRFSFRFG